MGYQGSKRHLSSQGSSGSSGVSPWDWNLEGITAPVSGHGRPLEAERHASRPLPLDALAQAAPRLGAVAAAVAKPLAVKGQRGRLRVRKEEGAAGTLVEATWPEPRCLAPVL